MFKKYLLDYETDEAGLGDGAGDDFPPVSDSPADEPEVTPDELDDAGAAVEPDYAAMFQRPEFSQALEGALGNVLSGIASQAPQPEQHQPQMEPLPEYDPYDPDSFQNYMDAREQRLLQMNAQAAAQAIQNVMAPFTPALEQTATEQWRQETETYYQNLEKQVGTFDHDLARQLASGAESLGYARQGEAHDHAARSLAEYTKKQRADAVEQYKKSVMDRDSTPYEPGVSGAGVHGENKPMDELEAARQWAGRKTATAI